jgi:inner membrane protein involved in colicin E2 resistance
MTDLGVDSWMNAVMSALGVIACAVFVTIYHLRATWWRSSVGRNQMAFVAAIGLLLLYTVLATVLQGSECALIVLRSIRTVAVAAVIVLVVQRTRLLLKAQRERPTRTGV